MKIIKKGSDRKNKETAIGRLTCPRCRTIFEFEKQEAEKIDPSLYRINCPDCNRPIAFDSIIFKYK